jgi:hypothetical protein
MSLPTAAARTDDVTEPRNPMEMKMIATRRTFALTSMVVVAASTVPALAASYTKLEEAELAQLTPDLRAQVEARVTNGQTVRGILETMLLNNVSALFAAQRVEAVDFEKGVAIFAMSDGTLKLVPFDVTTLVIKA